MVVTESEVISQSDVDSPLQSEQHQIRNHPFSSLGRQSSIYSLTLDEFQHTLSERGKNFGSMNMDEFLTSIWNAEENNNNNQATATSNNDQFNTANHHQGVFSDVPANDHRTIYKQPSLSRQGSLTLPAPLCRKTVDEVWSEIHREQQEQEGRGRSNSSSGGENNNNNNNNMQDPDQSAATRQPTFGEMTLEDFLIKAGVVREQGAPSPSHRQQQQYRMFNQNPAMGQVFVSRPVLGMSSAGGGGSSVAYPTMAQQGGGAGGNMGETSGRNIGGFSSRTGMPPSGPVYGGGGGYASSQAMGVVGQVSPVSSDALINNNVDNAANQFGIEMGGLRGRKRIIDGPVEKVVERRQRRMIKNRESAARSRARKQAYTVELEAELNQLKEENKQLRHALTELERKRKQKYLEDLRMKTQSRAQKAKETLRIMRRNISCPL